MKDHPGPRGPRHRVWCTEGAHDRAAEEGAQTPPEDGHDAGTECARKLLRLGGIGANASWLLALEFFSWRDFQNRRQIGSLSGLCGTPHQSGDLHREQGITKAGNRWVRALAIEIARGWLRYQPESELTRWYGRRFGCGSARLRKIGIVALARKLLIELWKYLQTGTPPAGARLKEGTLLKV